MKLKNPFVREVQRLIQTMCLMLVLLGNFSACAGLLRPVLLPADWRGTTFPG